MGTCSLENCEKVKQLISKMCFLLFKVRVSTAASVSSKFKGSKK